MHADRSKSAGDCACRISKVLSSVLHWSNFRQRHQPPFLLLLIRALSPAADVCLFCTGFMSNSEVRVGDDGDEVILFLCLSMRVEA